MAAVSTSDLLATGLPMAVHHADPRSDAVDDVVPEVIVEPETPEAAAAALAWASDRRFSVVIRGAGTKIGWGGRADRIDVLLSMRRLNRILDHRQGDLTTTVEAGASLGDVNRVLASHGQWLALDPPGDERATIGGLLATNDSGPRRHRFGTPRDLVIGITLATTDGRLGKAGGKVVKNVAGYDLSKLVSGSFGALAAIVSATFKLAPVASASGTVVVDAVDPQALERMAEVVNRSQLEPVAFDFHSSPVGERASCLVRFSSLASAVGGQVAECVAQFEALGVEPHVVTGAVEEALWREHSARLWGASGAIVRGSWLPARLTAALQLLASLPIEAAEAVGRVGVGAGLVRLEGTVGAQTAAIQQLRNSGVIGNVVVLRGSASLKAQVPVWGSPVNPALLKAVKSALDPHGILGAGRGPF